MTLTQPDSKLKEKKLQLLVEDGEQERERQLAHAEEQFKQYLAAKEGGREQSLWGLHPSK